MTNWNTGADPHGGMMIAPRELPLSDEDREERERAEAALETILSARAFIGILHKHIEELAQEGYDDSADIYLDNILAELDGHEARAKEILR